MESMFVLQKEEAQIVAKCGPALNTAVYSKFGCTAILHGMDAAHGDISTANKSKVTPEERYSIRLPKGLRVSVWKNDLTIHIVDAVVNAANEDLNHCGGLADALVQAGGQDIQRESDKITKKNGKVRTGEAVVTSAGSLPCKKIIHAVGPRVSLYSTTREIDDASKLLEKAIDNILKKVEEEKLKSVAIPALSSGIFNFPLKSCADIIVNSLKKYDKHRYGKNQITEVHLVNNDDRTVSEMVRACKEYLCTPAPAPTPKSYSGAAGALGNSHLSPVKLSNVTLHIEKGNIEKQETTVTVNSINLSLDLSNGAVTKAILMKAGQKLQEEVSTHRGKCTFGDVLRTKGYGLLSEYVYHVLCVHKDPWTKGEQMLGNVVSMCLHMAEKDNCSSIAFPAIGTGELGFSKSEVANIMTKAVKDFSSSYRGNGMDVHFVIYPSEENTFQAFAKQHASLQKSSPHASSSYTGQNESSPYEKEDNTSTPCIELRACFPEAQQAAKRWINDILNISRGVSTDYSIRNNHVLHFGQQEHEELYSLQVKFKVGLQVFFTNGQSGIKITGSPSGVASAVLEVEAMCCKVQEAFAQSEEAAMLFSLVRWRCKKCPQLETPEINAALEKAYLAGSESKVIDSDISVNFKLYEVQTKHAAVGYKIDRICFFKHYLPAKSYFERKLQDYSRDQWKFREAGLCVVREERVENLALQQLFELNKKRISGGQSVHYQRVPAQFCRLVSWVGFQREYAPPNEQGYGQGIYFSGSLRSAMRLWKGMEEEEFVYIIEAEVLTGRDTVGSPEFIVPPPTSDPLIHYDSVKGGTDTIVIFNGHQALPLSIYTCRKTKA